MAVNESRPFFYPADAVTCKAEANLSGRRFVVAKGRAVIDGIRANLIVNYPAAGGRASGVTGYDVSANAMVTVWRGHGVYEVESGAAITAGDPVKVDATGRVIPQGGTGLVVGIALDPAAGAGEAIAVDCNVYG